MVLFLTGKNQENLINAHSVDRPSEELVSREIAPAMR
jgi:hypothetical protein